MLRNSLWEKISLKRIILIMEPVFIAADTVSQDDFLWEHAIKWPTHEGQAGRPDRSPSDPYADGLSLWKLILWDEEVWSPIRSQEKF